MLSGPFATVMVEVVAPVALYLGLRWAGVGALWALLASAAIGVASSALRWMESGQIGLLGAIVLCGFIVSAVVALFTHNPVVLYLRDPAIDVVIAGLAMVTLRGRRPFVARIRRDLSADRAAFDAAWYSDPQFRAAHRRGSWWWAAGLVALCAVSLALLLTVPLDTAVALSQIIGGLVIGGLIVASETWARLAGSRVLATDVDGAHTSGPGR